MNSPRSENGSPASAAGAGGVLPASSQLDPAATFWGPALWLFGVILFAAAWLLGGVEAATILLAVLIGGLALSKPRSALSGCIVFLVYLFVFFQKERPLGPHLPSEFIYWGVGLAIISSGLFMAWYPHRLRFFLSRKSSLVASFDKAMLLILGMSLLASAYGFFRGNGWFAVSRQLFGCLLLPGYYLFARIFFRSVADIQQWLRTVCLAVSAGAAWYSVKITILSFSEGYAYAREQSPLAFFAGAAGGVLFVEILREREKVKRVLFEVSFLLCVLAILLMGSRIVAGSLASTAIILLILRRKKHRLLIGVTLLAMIALCVAFVVAHFNDLTQRKGLTGEVATRFSPIDLSRDASFAGRMAEMYSVLNIVHHKPIFGEGMGAKYTFASVDSPGLFETSAYVDNGWGFVLLKMGLLGLIIFVVMVWRFLKFAARDPSLNDHPSATRARMCLLAVLLFTLLSFIGGPTFFEFNTSAFVGAVLGGLAVLARLSGSGGRARLRPCHPAESAG